MSLKTFTADDFRRRALEQVGAPLEHAWRDHGDHVLNRDTIIQYEQLKLKDVTRHEAGYGELPDLS